MANEFEQTPANAFELLYTSLYHPEYGQLKGAEIPKTVDGSFRCAIDIYKKILKARTMPNNYESLDNPKTRTIKTSMDLLQFLRKQVTREADKAKSEGKENEYTALTKLSDLIQLEL